MALNNDLNGVLSNVAKGISPVIKLSNGLYTIVDKNTIKPTDTLGNGLVGYITNGCHTNDQIIYNFKLLGNWTINYSYNNETNKWEYTDFS